MKPEEMAAWLRSRDHVLEAPVLDAIADELERRGRVIEEMRESIELVLDQDELHLSALSLSVLEKWRYQS